MLGITTSVEAQPTQHQMVTGLNFICGVSPQTLRSFGNIAMSLSVKTTLKVKDTVHALQVTVLVDHTKL